MYVRELRVRYCRRYVKSGPGDLTQFLDPKEAASAFVGLLRYECVEVCGLFCLSTRYTLLAYHELSRGTTDTTLVHPRELFKVALLANATAVILRHNHPSGDPTPSPDDLILTERIVRAAAVIGVALLDHIIVGGDRYCSLKTDGQL